MVLFTRYLLIYMGIIVCLLWRNRWVLETQPRGCTDPKLNMLKIYGLHFFLKLFHFLRLRLFSTGMSFKFSPSVSFPGPCWFLCRSFLVCLPVYPPCCWAYSHQIVWSPVFIMFCLSKVWHQKLSLVDWPQPAFLANVSFSARHCRQSGLLIILWMPVAFLPLLILTRVSCGKSILSFCLIILSEPFLVFITLFMSHMLLGFSSWKWSLFPLWFSLCNLALTTDCFVFSHLYILVALQFNFKQCEVNDFVLYTFEFHPGPRGTHGWGKEHQTPESRHHVSRHKAATNWFVTLTFVTKSLFLFITRCLYL